MKITFSSVPLRKIPVISPVHPANNTTCQLNAMFFYDMLPSFLGILLFKLRRMTSQPLQLSAILFRHVGPPFNFVPVSEENFESASAQLYFCFNVL
jgi:hypothetical protein